MWFLLKILVSFAEDTFLINFLLVWSLSEFYILGFFLKGCDIFFILFDSMKGFL